jgi:hypothetical protein
MKQASLLFLFLFISFAWSQFPCIYISSFGNDTTGNGSSIYPFKTIYHAINSSFNSRNLTLCFSPGNYSGSVEINWNVSSIHFYGLLGNVSLYSLEIYPAENIAQLKLDFFQVTLSDIKIGQTNLTENIFEEVIFNSVRIGNCEKTTNWFVLARTIVLVNCSADTVLTGNINLNNFGMGSVKISNLLWENVTGSDVGFYITTSELYLMDSCFFKNSLSDSSLFIILNSYNSLTASLSNIIFDSNQLKNPSFFNITDNSNITVLNSTFTCNVYNSDDPTIPPMVLPFFYTNSVNITSVNNSISRCTIQCQDPTLAVNSMPLFPCVGCGVGNGSVDYICGPCAVNYYSMHGVCEECPIYSTQVKRGQDHCYCFSNSLVDDSNLDRCNNEVWGIIIAVIYLVIIAVIFLRKRQKNEVYESIN